jgi:hypothetical protein
VEVAPLVRVSVVLAIVVLVTVPFGFYRAYTRKLSLRWFLAIHVPVVFVFLARFEAHLSYIFIPLTVLTFTAAQFLGGRAGRWWISRRPTTPVAGGEEAAPQPPGPTCVDSDSSESVFRVVPGQSLLRHPGSP